MKPLAISCKYLQSRNLGATDAPRQRLLHPDLRGPLGVSAKMARLSLWWRMARRHRSVNSRS